MINFEKHIDELVHTYCGVTLCERCLVGRNSCISYKNRMLMEVAKSAKNRKGGER